MCRERDSFWCRELVNRYLLLSCSFWYYNFKVGEFEDYVVCCQLFYLIKIYLKDQVTFINCLQIPVARYILKLASNWVLTLIKAFNRNYINTCTEKLLCKRNTRQVERAVYQVNQICEKAISKESRFGPGTIITELNIPANKCGLVIGKGGLLVSSWGYLLIWGIWILQWLAYSETN